MDFISLMTQGVIVALLGTLLSGIVAVLGKGGKTHRPAQIILALANLVGFISALLFLKSGADQLPVATLHAFFNANISLDSLSAIFFLIVTGISFLVALYAIPYLERYRDTYHLPSLNLATALFIFGMQLVVLSGNIVIFMFAWEVMSMACFFLIMADRQLASIRASFLYLVITHLGAGAILAGFFLLTQGNIFIDFSALSYVAQSISVPVLTLAFALFFLGFGSKAGLVPFHVPLPEYYMRAPSHISALMSGVMLKVAVYGFLRVMFTFPIFPTGFGIAVLALGILSAIFGVLYAVIDRDIKRTLAFSSIENMGLIFTLIGLGFLAFGKGAGLLGNVVLIAAIFHCVAHAIFKSGLFMTAGAIVSETHTRNLEKMGGLAKRMPMITGAFCILALAAAALPPFGTFYGEWMALQGMIASFASTTDLFLKGITALVFIVMAFVAGLAVFAMVKLFAIASLGEPRSDHAAEAKEGRGLIRFSVGITSLLMVLLGAFAPRLFAMIGAIPLLDLSHPWARLVIPSEQGDATVAGIGPLLVFLAVAGVLAVVFVVRRLVSNKKLERTGYTWNCGQDIDATMEYTATAFSAPIRFFFRWVLRTQKTITVIPVIESNPWIASRHVTVNLRSVWLDYLYMPIKTGVIRLASQVKRIQNGSIQFYLALMFVALIVTLIFSV